MQPDYQIILPTYNEEKNLPILFHLLAETAAKLEKHFEILLVDDNSKDKTREVAEKMKNFYDNQKDGFFKIRKCYRPRKLGLGSAYVHAFQWVTADFVVIMDADLSHHVNQIFFIFCLKQLNFFV